MKQSSFKLSTTLEENPISRYFAFSFLYFAQGVPEGLTFFAIPAWMAMNNGSPGEIGGFLAAVGLPWSFKLIIAPMMDRYTILDMGRKRPWVIFGQIGLVLSFISLAFVPNPLENFAMITIMGFIVSVFGCFQDVATDGMAVDIIPVKEQARANGLMWGAKVVGISASLAVSTYLMNAFGFYAGILVPGLFVALIMLIPIIFVERKGEKVMPWMQGQASETSKKLQIPSLKGIIKNVSKAFILRTSLVISGIAFLIGASQGYLEAVFPTFTVQELDWTNTQFSDVTSSAKLVGGLLGMIAGGILVDKFGKRTMLYIYLIAIMLVVGGFIFYQSSFFNEFYAQSIIAITSVLNVFINIAMLAACMQISWTKVSATQFTLYMTIFNVGRVVGAGLFGPVKEYFEWSTVFLTFSLMTLFAIILLNFIGFQRHEDQLLKLDAVST